MGKASKICPVQNLYKTRDQVIDFGGKFGPMHKETLGLLWKQGTSKIKCNNVGRCSKTVQAKSESMPAVSEFR